MKRAITPPSASTASSSAASSSNPIMQTPVPAHPLPSDLYSTPTPPPPLPPSNETMLSPPPSSSLSFASIPETSPKQTLLPKDALTMLTLLGDIANKYITENLTTEAQSPSTVVPSISAPISSSANAPQTITANFLLNKVFTTNDFLKLTLILLTKQNDFPSDESPIELPQKIQEKVEKDEFLQSILAETKQANASAASNSSSAATNDNPDLLELPLCVDQLCKIINDCHLWLKNTFRKVEAEVNTTMEFGTLENKDTLLKNIKEVLRVYYYLIKALIFLQTEYKDRLQLNPKCCACCNLNPLRDKKQIADANAALKELSDLVPLTLDDSQNNKLLIDFFKLREHCWKDKWLKVPKALLRIFNHGLTAVKGFAAGALSAFSIRSVARMFVSAAEADTPTVNALMVIFAITNMFDTLWTRGNAMNNAYPKIKEQTTLRLPTLLKNGGNYGLNDTFYIIYNLLMSVPTVFSMILDGANGGFSARTLCKLIDIINQNVHAEDFYTINPLFKWSLFGILFASAAWSGLAFQFLPIFNIRNLRDSFSKMLKEMSNVSGIVRGIATGATCALGSTIYAIIQSGQTIDGIAKELDKVAPQIVTNILNLTWVCVVFKIITLTSSQGIKCTTIALGNFNPFTPLFEKPKIADPQKPTKEELAQQNKAYITKFWDGLCLAVASPITLTNLGFVTAITVLGAYRTLFGKDGIDLHEYITSEQMLKLCTVGGIIGAANGLSVYFFSEYPVIKRYSEEYRTNTTTLRQRMINLLWSVIGCTHQEAPVLQELPPNITPKKQEEIASKQITLLKENSNKLKIMSKKIWPICVAESLAYIVLNLLENCIVSGLAADFAQAMIRTGQEIFCPSDLKHSEMCLNYIDNPGSRNLDLSILTSAWNKFIFLEVNKPASLLLIALLPLVNFSTRIAINFLINCCCQTKKVIPANTITIALHNAEIGAPSSSASSSQNITSIQPTLCHKFGRLIKNDFLPEMAMGVVLGSISYITTLPRYSGYQYAPINDLSVIPDAQRDFNRTGKCLAPDGYQLTTEDFDCGGAVSFYLGNLATDYLTDNNPIWRSSMQTSISIFSILIVTIKSALSSYHNHKNQEKITEQLESLVKKMDSSESMPIGLTFNSLVRETRDFWDNIHSSLTSHPTPNVSTERIELLSEKLALLEKKLGISASTPASSSSTTSSLSLNASPNLPPSSVSRDNETTISILSSFFQPPKSSSRAYISIIHETAASSSSINSNTEITPLLHRPNHSP